MLKTGASPARCALRMCAGALTEDNLHFLLYCVPHCCTEKAAEDFKTVEFTTQNSWSRYRKIKKKSKCFRFESSLVKNDRILEKKRNPKCEDDTFPQWAVVPGAFQSLKDDSLRPESCDQNEHEQWAYFRSQRT